MSSTGRGPRLGGPDDCYATPGWCVRRLLEAWRPRDGWLLEPAAGDGAIIKAVTAAFGLRPWYAIECRATCSRALQGLPGVGIEIADFLAWQPADARMVADVGSVITNPPFHSAEAFIRHAGNVFPDSDLVFLVRLGFLAGGERAQLWSEFGAPDVYVLPNRPSFTPDGKTDSADYAWIVLPPKPRPVGEFRVLATTPAAERGKRVRIVANISKGAQTHAAPVPSVVAAEPSATETAPPKPDCGKPAPALQVGAGAGEDVGVAVDCTTCGRRKSPRGRSVPIEMGNGMCDWECPGYGQEPKPGDLWPGETREEFGYPRPASEDGS